MTAGRLALQLTDVRIELPDTSAIIEEVDLKLEPGQIVGLVGESGSGKTTTALSIFGYAGHNLKMSRGAIAIAGGTMLNQSMFRKARGRLVSYVPQNPGTSLNPSMRIGDALKDMIRSAADDKEAETSPRSLLERVGLPDTEEFARRFPHQLSGGQQQRVCIAAALASNPAVIVLDEPTTGLDVVTQDRILKELLRLRAEEHVALLYITHDLAVVAQIADRIAVMYAGRIVEQGAASEILSRPKHPYTRGLMASTPDHLVPHTLETMSGITVGVGERPPGCAFAPRCPQRTAHCETAVPKLSEISQGHEVRCFEWRRTPPVEWEPIALRPRLVQNDHPTTPVLRLDGVQAEYVSRGRRNVVAREISFSLEEGGCIALVGESGSGKTTVARVIAGLHPHFSGQVLLDEKELPRKARKRSLEARRRIQIVFQNPTEALNPKHSVFSAIARPAQILRGLDKASIKGEVAKLLDSVRLPSRMSERYPSELSGGERQRVAIARALAAGPDVIICDEVTSALDVSVQAVVLELLRDLRTEFGLSLLFISHDLGVVSTVADQILVMNRGVITESGDVSTVLTKPRDPYTLTLLNSAPSLSAAIEGWDSASDSEHRARAVSS
jgi:peptide/nickel transport system ATP-binding protein